MVKKLFTLMMGLGLALGASATITFPASDVQYWVGTGSNQAVVIIGWDDNPNGNFALVWGVRWNGSATAVNMLDTIATYDSRVAYNISSGFVTNIGYSDGTLTSGSSASYWCYTINGGYADAYSSQAMTNGDVMEISSSCYFTLTTATAATDPNGPVEATIAFSDIIYWVGTGSNEAVLAVNWADTALAWGYRWNGTATVANMMNDIAAADPRFSYTGTGMVDDILFNDGTVSLSITPGNWWGCTNNGITDMGLNQPLTNGDLEKWSDPVAGVLVDSIWHADWSWMEYIYVYPMEIHPVSTPVPQDATIDFEDILFWVGEGSNRVIFAVNWVDTALAWGFRYNSTATVLDAMNAIAVADPRFSYAAGGYGIDDILFVENGDTLRKADYSWWEHSINGTQSWGASQPLADGDFSRWADPMAGVLVDSVYDSEWDYWMYIYAYPMTIHPVSVPDSTGGHNPDPEHGPFCGAVGTEGCDAIPADSNIIVAWATGCSVVRGPVDITNPDGPRVHYGTDDMGIGPATTSTTDAVSLGDGGTATLTFARPIRNGEGPDFAVFENPFNDYFLELGFVEVSTDGERYVRFPATSLTQTDSQVVSTIDPTYINNLAGKYRVGYGTPFDLDELRDSTGINIDSIVYVRIVDVVGSIDPRYGTYDAFGHLVNDPWPTNDTVYGSGGFDLTGVAVMYENTNVGIDEVGSVVTGMWPNPATDRINVVCAADNVQARLLDICGRQVADIVLHRGINTISLANLEGGVYLLHAEGTVTKVVKH